MLSPYTKLRIIYRNIWICVFAMCLCCITQGIYMVYNNIWKKFNNVERWWSAAMRTIEIGARVSDDCLGGGDDHGQTSAPDIWAAPAPNAPDLWASPAPNASIADSWSSSISPDINDPIMFSPTIHGHHHHQDNHHSRERLSLSFTSPPTISAQRY